MTQSERRVPWYYLVLRFVDKTMVHIARVFCENEEGRALYSVLQDRIKYMKTERNDKICLR